MPAKFPLFFKNVLSAANGCGIITLFTKKRRLASVRIETKRKGEMAMKIISNNKKAYHDYFILDTYEAGIELKGTEIKSVRLGNVNLKDAFIRIKDNEAFVENMHISPYSHGNRFNHEPRRNRKLLLHKKEILKISNKLKEGGLTVVPTKLYFNTGSKVKLEIGLARGKKLYDKRQDIKERDSKREIQRALKNY